MAQVITSVDSPPFSDITSMETLYQRDQSGYDLQCDKGRRTFSNKARREKPCLKLFSADNSLSGKVSAADLSQGRRALRGASTSASQKCQPY